MYKSKFLDYPVVDLRWFWDEVKKCNEIANPEGVSVEKQIPIIKSELQEILDSKTEEEFIDGVIDSLVTIAAITPREEFVLNGERSIRDYWFKEHIKQAIYGREDLFIHNIQSLVSDLISVLVKDKVHYEENLESVLESNLSKFIPVEKFEYKHYADVCFKYPDSEIVQIQRDYEGQKYIVFYNESGKFLKGHSHFVEPNIQVGERL